MSEESAESRLVSTPEAAKALGVDRSTLSRYVRRGWLTPTYTLPSGQYRWDLADLRRQLAGLGQRRDEE